MKNVTDLALVTTTIYRPDVLIKWARAFESALGFTGGAINLRIIVVGDLKTDEEQVDEVLCSNEVTRICQKPVYLGPEDQEGMDQALSDAIGWNCIQRRNFGFLYAIRTGAEWILSIDDDNAPSATTSHTDNTALLLAKGLTGSAKIVQKAEVIPGNPPIPVFNHGSLADKPYYARGYPFSLRDGEFQPPVIDGIDKKPVGILQGMIKQDPDINAVDRLYRNPYVFRYQNAGPLVINAYTPINTQATVFHSSLIPAMLLDPTLKRYDDIIMGHVAQRIAWNQGRTTRWGSFTVDHERHPHNLMQDLEDELFGMKNLERAVRVINERDIYEYDPLDASQMIWRKLVDNGIGSERIRTAWIKAVRKEIDSVER